jgi:putative tricarboxylic transport membrane protein
VLKNAALVDVPMRVSNIAGKGGGNAWDALRQRAGDAHVLSVSSAPLITNKLLGVTDYDHAELTPVATLYTEYLAFVARADSPLRSAHDLIERLRADPAAMPIAIATARGTSNHIALGQIVQHLGNDPKRLNLRVFESALHAVEDCVQARADAAVISAVSAVKAIAAGTLRPLAVSAPQRMGGVFADAPAWAEQGVPCVIGQWRGILGAPNIDADAVAFWEGVLREAVQQSDWQRELALHHWTSTWKGAADTRAFLDDERVFLGGMLAQLGLIEAR